MLYFANSKQQTKFNPKNMHMKCVLLWWLQAKVDQCQGQLKEVQARLLAVTEETERLKPALKEKREALNAAKLAQRNAQVSCGMVVFVCVCVCVCVFECDRR